GEDGRDDYAVHVALAVDGDPLVGAVALPARGLVFSTGQHLRPADIQPGRLRLLVSRTRKHPSVDSLARALDAEVVEYGSAGAKAMAVLLGEAEIYAHAGGQYEWDSAAPVAVVRAAGLHASRWDGGPLVYNRPDPYVADLVICHPAVARQVLDCLAHLS
ncbi:MAG TPA: inositol monophosphatase family protein, partial [Acidimicrobiales bacterium]|nr:inositol monophosphatase family protein [Acidimicrobiales bacterium]